MGIMPESTACLITEKALADEKYILKNTLEVLKKERALKEEHLKRAEKAEEELRIANNLLRWVRDFAQVRANGVINRDCASKALEMLEIDEDGFDEMDKRLIEAIIHKFGGGPVGLNSLAVAVGEEAGTLEDVHEPYLIMQGYLSRTPQGRVAMPKAYRKLGLPSPRNKATDSQPDLLS